MICLPLIVWIGLTFSCNGQTTVDDTASPPGSFGQQPFTLSNWPYAWQPGGLQQVGPVAIYVVPPTVTVVKDAVSVWDWSDFEVPQAPVQPNPLPLGTSGSLTYKIKVWKNRDVQQPEGVFAIQAELQIITTASDYGILISDLGVTLEGPNNVIIRRVSVADGVFCTPNPYAPLPPGLNQLKCSVNIPDVALSGQAWQGGVFFQGPYKLTPYMDWAVDLATVPEGVEVPVAPPYLGFGTNLDVPQQQREDCANLVFSFDSTGTSGFSWEVTGYY